MVRRHILILNRLCNEFARYHRYVDHAANRVTYIATPGGAEPLESGLAEEIVIVDDLDNAGVVAAEAKELVARHGPVSRLVALSELDLEFAAILRAELDIPGKTVEQTRRVRDKMVMKEHVARAGLRVPRFDVATSPDRVRDFAAAVGLPLVLKPRAGADSQGVHVLRSADALERLLDEHDLTDYECEEFIEGNLYQVDGIVAGGEIRILRSWRCIGSCLDFARGTPFGSVTNDDPDFERRVTAFTVRVLASLGLTDDVFHLELFRTVAPVGPDDEFADMVFLEIGARAGGGQLRYVWRDVFGVDLIDASLRIHLGEPLTLPTMDLGLVGGYLMMPEPPQRPCIVERVSSLVGRVPAVYDEAVPPPGTILDGFGGARHTAGAYRFRGSSSAAVERAIAEAVSQYRISWSAVPAGVA